MVGAFVIILDPIFKGLAVSLLFGGRIDSVDLDCHPRAVLPVDRRAPLSLPVPCLKPIVRQRHDMPWAISLAEPFLEYRLLPRIPPAPIPQDPS